MCSMMTIFQRRDVVFTVEMGPNTDSIVVYRVGADRGGENEEWLQMQQEEEYLEEAAAYA